MRSVTVRCARIRAPDHTPALDFCQCLSKKSPDRTGDRFCTRPAKRYPTETQGILGTSFGNHPNDAYIQTHACRHHVEDVRTTARLDRARACIESAKMCPASSQTDLGTVLPKVKTLLFSTAGIHRRL